jgi:hypothetical protein
VNQLRAVCLVCQERGSYLPTFLGSCFAFRKKTHFLTAAHCVTTNSRERFVVLTPWEGVYSAVGEVNKHPKADLAILKLQGDGRDSIQHLTALTEVRGIGGDYYAYGFPEDSVGPNAGTPTARLFKGHCQRTLMHDSHIGYKYDAMELSFPCPGGLSGGPLFGSHLPTIPVGLVTENIEAATLLHSQEILLKDGKPFTEYYHRVISYGIGLLLQPYQEWIDKHVF